MTDVTDVRAASRTDDQAATNGRAAIARLTLQLRAARQELAQAEAAAASDHTAARQELRNRLDPMIEERTRVLEASLAQARDEAAATVAAAHRRAAMLVAWFDHGTTGLAEATPAQPVPGPATAAPAAPSKEALSAAIRDVLRQMEEIDTLIVREPARIRAEAASEAQRILADARRTLVAKAGGDDAV